MRTALGEALDGIDKNDLEPVTLRGVGLALGDLAVKALAFAIVIGGIVLIIAYWKAILVWGGALIVGGFALATIGALIVAIWKTALR